MTNPAATMRMLITYVILIPVAILVGYLLTNPLDFGTLGFLGLIIALIISPIFIRWHYPLLVFGLACPMVCFFLLGKPPLSQVAVFGSLAISIVERTLNSDKRFISAPVMIWPLLFLAGMMIMTAELTGGIGLHSLGGDTGGGRKYIAVLAGICTYFALVSQRIPRDRWKFYLALSLLPSIMGSLGDFFPYLPSPLNYVNLLFPPTQDYTDVTVGTTRLTALAGSFGVVPYFLLARYGLRGIFLEGKLWRPVIFIGFFGLSLLGGYRNTFIGFVALVTFVFFMEGLHRSRLMPLIVLVGVMGISLLGAFSTSLPYTFQRSMSVLPFFKWDSSVLADAEGSSEWRLTIWRATWPKVPQYLLLGKGYGISADDYSMIGNGTFAGLQSSHLDAAEAALAISGDYHSGPLSTLMPFGIWGAIGMIWLMLATTFVVYRNYRYGDPELRVFNCFMLASCVWCIVSFFFIFGAFNNDVGGFAKLAGFSIAMNWGVARRLAKPEYNARIKPLPESSPLPQPT
jgi:hypothetical protein